MQVEDDAAGDSERNGEQRGAHHLRHVPGGEMIAVKPACGSRKQQRGKYQPDHRRWEKKRGKKQRLPPHFDSIIRNIM